MIYTLTNNSAGAISWSLVNTSSWLTVFPVNGTLVSGSPATQVTASVSALASNLAAGSYGATLQFSNLTDRFGQTRQITLAIVTPPVITAQPANQAVLQGATASFNVGAGPNALLYYQWQVSEVNLTDGGNISGSTTDTLTITNVTGINTGSYSVIVSNAAGLTSSSNALLTITPSAAIRN